MSNTATVINGGTKSPIEMDFEEQSKYDRLSPLEAANDAKARVASLIDLYKKQLKELEADHARRRVELIDALKALGCKDSAAKPKIGRPVGSKTRKPAEVPAS